MNTTILQHCIYLSTIDQNKDLVRLGKHVQLDGVNNLHFIFMVPFLLTFKVNFKDFCSVLCLYK